MEGSKTAENCLLRLLCILLCLVAYTYGKATDGLMDDRIYGEENDLMKTNQQQKLQHYLEALKVTTGLLYRRNWTFYTLKLPFPSSVLARGF